MTFVKDFYCMHQISLNFRRQKKRVPKQSVNLGSIAVAKFHKLQGQLMIPILALRHRKMKIDYFCRKQKYSVNTQAVVGVKLIILDLAKGYTGRFLDSRVLRKSNIF